MILHAWKQYGWYMASFAIYDQEKKLWKLKIVEKIGGGLRFPYVRSAPVTPTCGFC